MRKFRVHLEVDVELELQGEVIERVDDDWRSVYCKLHTPEEIAAHIGGNLIHGCRLSHLDGWADLPDRWAFITWEEEWAEAEEVT